MAPWRLPRAMPNTLVRVYYAIGPIAVPFDARGHKQSTGPLKIWRRAPLSPRRDDAARESPRQRLIKHGARWRRGPIISQAAYGQRFNEVQTTPRDAAQCPLGGRSAIVSAGLADDEERASERSKNTRVPHFSLYR